MICLNASGCEVESEMMESSNSPFMREYGIMELEFAPDVLIRM